ncbi:histidine phosphatase family protein [Clostridium uliginosum]|uniref:phosphoglycerate mutase (2,3-diphosphoglycerate-dependent) n=1 Tax=Clostridium uliginosum TaxID=119641 RepID=A0A1I1IMS3_9CLOT|nr:histidine phosphatase family protein [Clostridium uliginosum]SFC37211.1 probable phosphoglycerate mutase [Clostridium uliginosum]
MKIYLVRHGESIGNEKQLIFGITDYPLTETGFIQAKQSADKLKNMEFSSCYTSELSRAYATAEICMNGRTESIIKLSGLNEQNFGILEGSSFDNRIQKDSQDFGRMIEDLIHNPPSGSENYEDMCHRVSKCLDEIVSKGKDALIVSHSGPLSIIIVKLLGLSLENVHSFYFEHGTYSMIEIQGKASKLRCFNK